MYRVMRFVIQTKDLMLKYKDSGEEKGDELIKLKHQLDQLLNDLKEELKSDQKTIDHSFSY